MAQDIAQSVYQVVLGSGFSGNVPTDLPVFNCPETGREIQFAQQLEVLRRCQLRYGKVWAIGLYPSLIRDPLLYVEAVSAHASYVFWTREVERDENEHRLDLEIQRLWHEATKK